MTAFIDTHCHLDGPEFDTDRAEVMARAREAGCQAICLPAIDLASSQRIVALCQQHDGFLLPMVGLHPEEVRGDWQRQLADIRPLLGATPRPIAIGEVGLDFYWSREFEQEQMLAFEQQVEWAEEQGLPLMIHCRKAQNEMVKIMRRHASRLARAGVFHCFTGNEQEARELLAFEGFCLGIGGVLTFKKSNLPQTLAQTVPLSRIVLETDAPYMAPVPMRGQRNESAFITHVIARLAETYGVTQEHVAQVTTDNARRMFDIQIIS